MSETDHQTKTLYQSKKKAAQYHAAFSQGLSPKNLRLRYIAFRERQIVDRYLSIVKPNTILDVPCGTGKLAPVLANHGEQIIASDISEEMIEIARKEYESQGLLSSDFIQADILNIKDSNLPKPVDAVVCLRLLHRVSHSFKKDVIKTLSEIARYAVVTLTLDSPFDSLRRPFGRLLFSITHPPKEAMTTKHDFEALISPCFEICMRRRTLRGGLSGQVAYLLKSKDID